MLDINIKNLSVQELENLEKDVSQLHKEIKKEILSKQDDFDTWLQYGEKKHYCFALDRSTLTRQFMLKNMYMERYQTIDIDDIIESLDQAIINDDITQDEEKAIKQELIKLKFGSMEYDW